MKLRLLCCATLASICLCTNAFAATKLVINDQPIQTDVPPTIIDGRTLVPARAILENLGMYVSWDPTTKVITGTSSDCKLKLTIDSKTALVNDTTVTLDAPAKSINGRILVPARFVAEALGCTVDWDAKTQTINIKKNIDADAVIFAPDSIFTTTAEENGFNTQSMFVIGSATKSATILNQYNATVISTDRGDVALVDSGEVKEFADIKRDQLAYYEFVYVELDPTLKIPVGIYFSHENVSSAPVKKEEKTPATTPVASQAITGKTYNQIEIGMTLAQVQEIIKDPGELIAEQDNMAIYVWTAEGYNGAASIYFVDGKASYKTQYGLL